MMKTAMALVGTGMLALQLSGRAVAAEAVLPTGSAPAPVESGYFPSPMHACV